MAMLNPPNPLDPVASTGQTMPPLTLRSSPPASAVDTPPPVEIDGPSGPEPTRYGDWERGGRCIDF